MIIAIHIFSALIAFLGLLITGILLSSVSSDHFTVPNSDYVVIAITTGLALAITAYSYVTLNTHSTHPLKTSLISLCLTLLVSVSCPLIIFVLPELMSNYTHKKEYKRQLQETIADAQQRIAENRAYTPVDADTMLSRLGNRDYLIDRETPEEEKIKEEQKVAGIVNTLFEKKLLDLSAKDENGFTFCDKYSEHVGEYYLSKGVSYGKHYRYDLTSYAGISKIIMSHCESKKVK